MNVDALPDWLRRKIRLDSAGCWSWTGATEHAGYGKIGHRIGGRLRWFKAHRVVWEYFYGPWPEGMVCDHLCHDPMTCTGGIGCPHRRCVNPTHLVVATGATNNSAARSSKGRANRAHCLHGHEYTVDNIYWGQDQGYERVRCRTCVNEQNRAAYARRRQRIVGAT